MKKALLTVLAGSLLLLLISCGSEQLPITETTDIPITTATETEKHDWWYVPKEEWQGLETTDYRSYEAEYVAAHPNGSPNPQPEDSTVDKVDLSRIEIHTQKEKYSIAADRVMSFEISYLPIEQDNSRVVFYYHELNVDKKNEETWARLIDTWFTVVSDQPEYVHLESGEPFIGYFSLDGIINKLTPGKYRLVAYVNYEPVYAEFELTE